MNILDIKYCTQDLRFEEEAYKNFETYEQELKTYFLEQPDGYEIFEDLKLRICEMLQSKMKISGNAISTEDIEDIKKSIGHVKQLEEDIEGEEMVEQEPQVTYRDKKLYRSENEKFIGGVCGGLGNYFSIDPLAFRLLFVLVALFSKGIGVIVYAVFWIALQPKVLPVNLTKRLYRNGADKVIAGVCGGLASFFKTEAWIIRVIFLSPLILNVSSGMFNFGFNVFNGSAMGFSIIAYIILWITTKESETATEELLARGEDININSISE
jgi:phage shock protein PspC (stress-responsive transcriptional regulator)